MHGEPVTLEGTAQMARCVQHETDHLDGVLFIDRLDPEQRKLAMKADPRRRLVGRVAAAGQGLAALDPRRCLLADGIGQLMRVAFAGTPRAAVPSLEALLRSRHEVVAVITRPDAPAGRGRRPAASPVAERAAEAGLEVLKLASPAIRSSSTGCGPSPPTAAR